MRRNQIGLVVVALLVVVSLMTSGAKSEEKAAAKKAPTPEEMMAAMVKYGMPGAEHAALKPLVGTFDAEVTMQMTPETPAMTSKGKTSNAMILDGRFLAGHYEGDFGGQPFKGHQLLGYDLFKKKYVSLWIDSMSTAVMSSEGTADASGKVLTFMCTFDCPVDSTKKTAKQVLTIVDDNTNTFENYDIGADGKEFKSMSIKYTRAK